MAENMKASTFTDANGNTVELVDAQAVRITPQMLTEEQKAQVRMNIGVEISEDGVRVEDVEYTYDGDIDSDGYTWVNGASGSKTFVKVADIPDGEINLVGGYVSVIVPSNVGKNYSFEITEDMLAESVDHFGWIIPAKVDGLTQIFHQNANVQDETLVSAVVICTRPGRYAVSFNGWGDELLFVEKGIYFADSRAYSGNKYTASMTCTVTIREDAEDTPVKYSGNEIEVFTRGLCIGDSITEGVFNHNDGEVGIKKYSYPSVLKRMTGIDIVNAGVAGLTSKTWYEASLDSKSQYGSWVNNEWAWTMSPEAAEGDVVSDSLDYSNFDFAIIHLGINDLGMMGDATIEETIATFETNINNIITKLKTESKGIKIFFCTIIPSYANPGNRVYELLNEKIREIATLTDDVYLIDLNAYSDCYSGTPYDNQHLTAIGYQKMASEIMSLISSTIYHNLDDFKWVQFIGTNYSA